MTHPLNVTRVQPDSQAAIDILNYKTMLNITLDRIYQTISLDWGMAMRGYIDWSEVKVHISSMRELVILSCDSVRQYKQTYKLDFDLLRAMADFHEKAARKLDDDIEEAAINLTITRNIKKSLENM